MPITQNEKELKQKDEVQQNSRVQETFLFESSQEEKSKSAFLPHRKQGMVIPGLQIEVIDEGSNPSRQYKDSESVEINNDFVSSKKPELKRKKGIQRIESDISSFMSSENDDHSQQDNITQLSAAIPRDITKSAAQIDSQSVILNRYNKQAKNAAESSNQLTIHRNSRWMLDLRHGTKMANISSSNNDIAQQNVSGKLTSNLSNTNLSIKKTKKRTNEKSMLEEEIKNDIHNVAAKYSRLLLPTMEKILMQSKKVKKSNSKKEMEFLNTVKFKKPPHEKGSYQNTKLKFALINKKSNENTHLGQLVSDRHLSDLGRSENCVSQEIRPLFQKQVSKDLQSSQAKYFNRLRKLQTIDQSTLKDPGAAASAAGVSSQELFQLQQFNYLKMVIVSQQKNKVLEEKIAQLQENHGKKIEQLEIKLKNTKIFLNMVIHDMRNPTTSIEFAVKEVIKMLERKIKLSKTNGLNGMIGPMTQMMNMLQPQITNPFSNTSGNRSNSMQIQKKSRVQQSVIQSDDNNSDVPKQLFSQGFKAGNNVITESNHQFDHNRYDEHKSSSSEEEKKMHESAVMDLDPNDGNSIGEKSRKSSPEDIDEIDLRDSMQKSSGVESIVSKDIQSNADHASNIPFLRALQSTCSPLLFDIKAPVQGRQMIPISSSNLGNPSNNILPSHRRSNILANTSPKDYSGRVGSHFSELKSAMSKNRGRQQDEGQKRHVRIVQITDSKAIQAKSDINLHPEKKKTSTFKISDQRIGKSDMDLPDQENANQQKQPRQKVSVIITKTLLQEGGDISEVDDHQAMKPSSKSSSSSAISDQMENEEEKKDQLYYQTFGKPNSQGGGSDEEEEEEEKKQDQQNTQQQQIVAQNMVRVSQPFSNQAVNQQQELGQLYAEALRQRLSLFQSQSGGAPTINLQNQLKSFKQLTMTQGASIQTQYEEMDNLLKTANFSASMLLNLINDLLDLAKMENQSFNLNASYFNLEEEVIKQSVQTLAHMIKEKKISVNITFSKGQNLNEGSEHYLRCIFTDKARFLQIMLNFMSNAIKFTPEGGNVSIETVVKETQDIRKREKSGDLTNGTTNNKGSDLDNKNIKKIKNEFEMMTAKRCLTPRIRQDENLKGMIQPEIDQEIGKKKYINFEIRIKDSGVGIAKENLSKLFLNFSRLEDHQKSNERGTGLGLSICKSLLEKMGGTVTVESEGLGFGTTFIMQMQAKCKVLPSKLTQGPKTSAMNLSNNLNHHRMMKSQLNIRVSTSQPPQKNSKKKKLHELGRMKSGLVAANSITVRKKNFNKNKLKNNNGVGEDSLSRVDNKSDHSQGDGKKQFVNCNKHRTGIFSPIVPSAYDDQNLALNIKSHNIPQMNQFGIPIMLSSGQQKSMVPFNPFKSNIPYDGPSPRDHSRANQSIINQLDLSVRYDNQSIGDFDIQDNDQPRYRVLLANDDTFQLLMINRVLGLFDEFSQRIEQVENGMVAVNKVLESKKAAKGGAQEYDVILLDLDMPILDGYGACRQIKDAENGGNQGIHALLQLDNSCVTDPNLQTPDNGLQKRNHASIIIALTALLNQDIIEKCKQAGFDDWIESPLTKDKIQEKIIDKLALMRGYKDPNADSPSLDDQSEDNEYDEEYDEECGEEVEVDESELNEDSVVMEDEEGADESEKDNGPEVPHQGKREPYMEGLRTSFHIPSEKSKKSHLNVKD